MQRTPATQRSRRPLTTSPASRAVPFFYPGPAGYDAVVMARAAGDARTRHRLFPNRSTFTFGGSALVYELDEPVGHDRMAGARRLEADFPGIRRLFLENHVRYTFVRYGVP